MTMPRQTDNPATGIIGKPAEPVRDEAEHFYICPACGQAVDMRDLGQVLHHEKQGHKRLRDDG